MTRGQRMGRPSAATPIRKRGGRPPEPAAAAMSHSEPLSRLTGGGACRRPTRGSARRARRTAARPHRAGGKVAAALNVLDGADRAARFLIGATRKGWREDFTLRFAAINGLPGIIVDGPAGVAAMRCARSAGV
jgi:hypothetical protein